MQSLKVFQSRKMLALGLLGFASGLPLYLTSDTLKAWMTEAQVSLTSIGLFSLVALPYSLKFLWSPLLDRYVPPFLGRRRGWLVLTQIALVIAIAAMAFQQPRQSLQLVAINAMILAFFSASQDIAVDAHRTDSLAPLEMGAGTAVYLMGYRGAIIAVGAGALILADYLPWSIVYLIMAALMGLCVLVSLFAPEPETVSPPSTLFDAVYLPFRDFVQRLGWGRGLAILLFVVLYRYGDALVNSMTTPFLLQLGFSKTVIGTIRVGMGMVASILGALTGGAVLSRIGINRSLWVFGGLQTLSNLAYYGLAQVGQNYSAMLLAINIENFCGGLGTAGFLAFLMSLCNQRFSATQYALLSSLVAVSRDILTAPAGRIAETMGWPNFFLLTIAAAIPGFLLLPFFAPWKSELPAD
jgi:MFS transporter, PAT family, beta-lactamase induction signal transducer AmpG